MLQKLLFLAKLLPDLKYERGVKVHCVYSGAKMCADWPTLSEIIEAHKTKLRREEEN